MIGAMNMATKSQASLPSGTIKRSDPVAAGEPSKAPLILSTKAKAKRAEKSERQRDTFYTQIGKLYADGDKGADELLAKAKAMNKVKFKPTRSPATGSPETKIRDIDHPTLAGMQERVHHIVDPLHAMVKRKHITEREYFAGDHYRTCYATLYSAMGSVMDFERVRGGSLSGSPPAPTYMLASEVVSETRKFLYPKDYAVMHRVCALGMTLEETTAHLYGADAHGSTTRTQRDACSGRLKAALEMMADHHFPEHKGKGDRMRSFVQERAIATDAIEVPKAQAVHATSQKVYRTGRV